MQPRDQQAKKVFVAEDNFGRGKEFDSLAEIQVWVDKIVASRWWKNRSPFKYVRIMSGQVNALAAWSRPRGKRLYVPTLKLPKWARRELVILHELCHHMTDPSPHHRRYADHGPEFCKNLLALVKRWMGQDAATDLRASFKTSGVKIRSRK